MNKSPRKSLRYVGLLASLLLSCALLRAPRPAEAASTYTVTSTLDDGSVGTLRSEVALANDDPNSLIVFAPGVAGVIALQSELDLSASMVILGPGVGVVQIDGGGASRLFSVPAPDVQVTLSGLTLQNGTALNDPNGVTSGAGGAVYSAGNLALTGCAFSGNGATYGGAVYCGGYLTADGCTFSGNSAGEGAGGAVYSATLLRVSGCTFSGNAAFYAGGLYSSSSGIMTACTLSGNAATGSESGNSGAGGGVYNDGQLTLSACVITGNNAYGGSADNGGPGGAGGGVYSDGILLLTGCTVSANAALPNGGSNDTGLGGGADNQGTFYLDDDIFYGDAAASGPEIANDTADSPGASVQAAACDIRGSGSDGTGGFGQNILDIDPLFVRPVHTGGAGDPGDLHLRDDSPCILAGTPDSANPTDRDGIARPDPPSIGAYDFVTTAPVAYGRNLLTSQGQPVILTLTGADPYSRPLSFGITVFPTGGTLSGSATNLIYTPALSFSGTDSFAFISNDGLQDSLPATVTVTVTPAFILTGLAFPSPVPAGAVTTATVTLSQPAPADLVVGLTSSDSSVVHLHRAVLVPAGASSATFPLTTYPSPTTKTVTIQASLGKIVVSVPLTITGQ